MDKQYYVYIATKYNINKLVYYEVFPSAEEAISAEKKIRGWLRQKKIDLIKSINPEFHDLTENEILPPLAGSE